MTKEYHEFFETKKKGSYSISDIDKKIEALRVYDSEMRTPPHPRSYENCDRLSLIAGSESGLQRAERFMLLREVL